MTKESPNTCPLMLPAGRIELHTLEQIIAKFPPKIEMFLSEKDKTTILFRKVSRDESGTALSFALPTEKDFAVEHLIFLLKKRMSQIK